MNDIKYIHLVIPGLYISGTLPLENSASLQEYDIQNILCCVPKKDIGNLHQDLLLENSHICVLYLPYRDTLKQNLWQRADNLDFIKYTSDFSELQKNTDTLSYYHKKPLIEVGYDFIDASISNKKNILVHCQMGKSRSASVIIYYLMRKYNMTYNSAKTLLRSKRSLIEPNSYFEKQLSVINKKN